MFWQAFVAKGFCPNEKHSEYRPFFNILLLLFIFLSKEIQWHKKTYMGINQSFSVLELKNPYFLSFPLFPWSLLFLTHKNVHKLWKFWKKKVNISELNMSLLFQLATLTKFHMQHKELWVSFLCRRQPAMTNGRIATRFPPESKLFF